MSRKYYTLAEKDNGIWCPQYGSYDKSEVRQEMEDWHDSDCGVVLRIVTSGDTQAEIDQAITVLNGSK